MSTTTDLTTDEPVRGFRSFRTMEQEYGEGFRRREFAKEMKEKETVDLPGTDVADLIDVLQGDFIEAWGGQDPACPESPELCPGIEELSSYAAWFAYEFAALGASLEESVKMTLDLHDALDREYHTAEEPSFLAEQHFAAVYPDRLTQSPTTAEALDEDEEFSVEETRDLLLG